MSVTQMPTVTERPMVPPETTATARERTSMNRVAQLLCIACGPAMIVLFAIGSVGIAKFFPPAIHPQWEAGQVTQYYADHQTAIRIGMVISCCAYGLMATWGVGIAAQIRRKEGLFPVLSWVQLTSMAVGTTLIVAATVLWAGAAYRPGEIDPDITMTLNDVGWLMMLGTWIAFTLWNTALGLAILLDRSDTPAFPRWSGYLAIVLGISYAVGSGDWFVQHGAFGWRGAITLYIPFVDFGAWALLFSYLAYKNVKAGYVHEQDVRPAL